MTGRDRDRLYHYAKGVGDRPVHEPRIGQGVDKRYSSACSCGWGDRQTHSTRAAAETAHDDHVLAAGDA